MSERGPGVGGDGSRLGLLRGCRWGKRCGTVPVRRCWLRYRQGQGRAGLGAGCGERPLERRCLSLYLCCSASENKEDQLRVCNDCCLPAFK